RLYGGRKRQVSPPTAGHHRRRHYHNLLLFRPFSKCLGTIGPRRQSDHAIPIQRWRELDLCRIAHQFHGFRDLHRFSACLEWFDQSGERDILEHQSSSLSSLAGLSFFDRMKKSTILLITALATAAFFAHSPEAK